MARTAKTSKEEASFENKLARLEELTAKLESGDLPLEQALKTFEEGMKLSQQLAQMLDAAERKIEVLLAKPGGGAVIKDFEPDLQQSEDEG